MTVFKGYMKILKKNIGLVIMYLIIFFSVALALQAAAGKEGSDSYQSKSVEIGTVDEDGELWPRDLRIIWERFITSQCWRMTGKFCKRICFTEMWSISCRFRRILYSPVFWIVKDLK